MPSSRPNTGILVIDGNRAIHESLRKIPRPPPAGEEFAVVVALSRHVPGHR